MSRPPVASAAPIVPPAAALLSLLVQPAHAQLELELAEVLDTGAGPVRVVVADLDGDGLADLAAANRAAGDLTVFLREPGGGFTAGTVDVEGFPASLHAARLTFETTCPPDICAVLDEPVDLIVADGAGQVRILRNAGDGSTFTEYVGLDDSGPWNIAVGADGAIVMSGAGTPGAGGPGFIAVVGSNSFTSFVSSRVGDGNGGLPGTDIDQSFGNQPVRMAVARFDGDGNDDLAVVHRDSGVVAVLLYDTHVRSRGICWKGIALVDDFGEVLCPGNGADPPDLEGLSQPVDVVAAHLDDDAHTDLAVLCAGDATLRLFPGNGDGTFEPGAVIDVPAGPTALAAGDLDGDGDTDLAVTSVDAGDLSGALALYIRNDFDLYQPVGVAALGLEPSSVAIAELASGGLADLAVADQGCASVYVVRNLGFSTCPWDLTGDAAVAEIDLMILLAWWGANPAGPPDFDGDATVGTPDLVALLANWGGCP